MPWQGPQKKCIVIDKLDAIRHETFRTNPEGTVHKLENKIEEIVELENHHLASTNKRFRQISSKLLTVVGKKDIYTLKVILLVIQGTILAISQ